MSHAVVVTAAGHVGPHGAGMDALAAGLAAGALPLTEIDRSAGFHREGSARCAALVPERAH